METGSQLQQKGRQDSAVLSLSALSAPQRRPQQVGLCRSPEGLFSGRTDAAQRPSWPPAHNPRTDRQAGAGVGGKGRGRLAKEHALERWRNPSLPSQIEISPTPKNWLPGPRGSRFTSPHTAHRRTFRPRPSNAGHWFPTPTPRGKKSCLRHRAGSSNPGTLGDATLR